MPLAVVGVAPLVPAVLVSPVLPALPPGRGLTVLVIAVQEVHYKINYNLKLINNSLVFHYQIDLTVLSVIFILLMGHLTQRGRPSITVPQFRKETE